METFKYKALEGSFKPPSEFIFKPLLFPDIHPWRSGTRKLIDISMYSPFHGEGQTWDKRLKLIISGLGPAFTGGSVHPCIAFAGIKNFFSLIQHFENQSPYVSVKSTGLLFNEINSMVHPLLWKTCLTQEGRWWDFPPCAQNLFSQLLWACISEISKTICFQAFSTPLSTTSILPDWFSPCLQHVFLISFLSVPDWGTCTGFIYSTYSLKPEKWTSLN